MIKVSIIILNWNGEKDTIQCLESIRKLQATNYKLQIIVVDNASTDGSIESISKFQISRLQSSGAPATGGQVNSKFQIIQTKANLGFAGGNNIGIRCALENGADYVLILNNDTILDKDLVVQLIKAAETHKEGGIFSPKICFASGFEFHKGRYAKQDLGRVIWYAGGIMDWDNVLGSNRGVDEVDNGQYDAVSDTDFATGACMFIKREVLEKVGLFDEKYFMYFEDADLCQRAKRHSWKVLYVPGAKLWHKVARSSGIGSELNDYYITRNRLLFGVKYASLRTKIALLRESVTLLFFGRKWQKKGVSDFYLGHFRKGSFK